METLSNQNYVEKPLACKDNIEDENVLNRVANLPVVATTWNAMHYYYTGMKKKYPNVTPYLEAAENLTVSAANIAISKSKPVVDKFGPTVNSYANKGLDTLENKMPIITKDPEEIKSRAANVFTDKVHSALDATEKYVDYYLPVEKDELEMEDVTFDESLSISSESEDSEDDDVDDARYDQDEKEKMGAGERIRNISNKVRHRSYKKAMKKWQGVQVRSKEALNKLRFTVDLIQYAQEALNSSGVVSAANEKVATGVIATLDGLQYAADSVNKHVEERVLVKARNLAQQLNKSCQAIIVYLENSPRFHPLLDQAKKAKDATEDLYSSFSGKSSISQFSSSMLESTRPKLKFVEETLLKLFEHAADQPPISWLLSKSVAEETETAVKDKEE